MTLEEYFNRNNSIYDALRSVEFGTPIAAQIGGSQAQFRFSDNVNFVSKVMAESPESAIQIYGKDLNQVRSKFGLNDLTDTDVNGDGIPDAIQILDNGGVTPDGSGTGGASQSQWQGFNLNPFDSLTGLFEAHIYKLAAMTVGVTLLFAGILYLALQNPTVRNAAKTAVKTAAVV